MPFRRKIKSLKKKKKMTENLDERAGYFFFLCNFFIYKLLTFYYYSEYKINKKTFIKKNSTKKFMKIDKIFKLKIE